MIHRLVGPRTHICWTPDYVPADKRDQVSLVLEADLVRLEAEVSSLRAFKNSVDEALNSGDGSYRP